MFIVEEIIAMENDHRKVVCKTVVRFMSSHKGVEFSELSFPDEQQRNNKAVDVKAPVNNSPEVYFLEHTRIESFPGQIGDDHAFNNLFGPLEARLNGKLPAPGHYMLGVMAGVTNSFRGDYQNIRDTLINWIIEKAPTLQVGSPSTAPNHFLRESINGIEVTLYRWPGSSGRFYIFRAVPTDLEDRRRDRTQKALNDKCPKLAKAKGESAGSVSVLVLESNDIALANYPAIANMVASELLNRNDCPDEIYLIETEIKPWVVWILKDITQVFPDDAGPHYIETEVSMGATGT